MGEPAFHALLFADKVITEDNKKRGVIGIFHVFNLQKFPGQTPLFYIYASFSNILGDYEFNFNLVREKSPDVVLSVGGELHSETPEAVIELSYPVQVVFPKPGKYTLTFNLAGEQVSSRVLTVTKSSSE